MIYLLAGQARSGKNTFASYLREELELRGHIVCQIELMRTLKGYCRDYFGWDGKDETKPRELLQRLGTEIIREKMNQPLFHIERLLGDISVLSYFYDTFIVDDVRFPLEIEEIRKVADCVAIHITRENLEKWSDLTSEESKHITETALLGYEDYDYEVYNQTLEKMRKDAEKIVKEVDRNEKNDK